MSIDLTTLTLAKNYVNEKIEKAAIGDIELDTGLNKPGRAADSYAVGQAILDLKQEIIDALEIAEEGEY